MALTRADLEALADRIQAGIGKLPVGACVVFVVTNAEGTVETVDDATITVRSSSLNPDFAATVLGIGAFIAAGVPPGAAAAEEGLCPDCGAPRHEGSPK